MFDFNWTRPLCFHKDEGSEHNDGNTIITIWTMVGQLFLYPQGTPMAITTRTVWKIPLKSAWFWYGTRLTNNDGWLLKQAKMFKMLTVKGKQWHCFGPTMNKWVLNNRRTKSIKEWGELPLISPCGSALQLGQRFHSYWSQAPYLPSPHPARYNVPARRQHNSEYTATACTPLQIKQFYLWGT